MQRFEHVVVNQNGTFLPGASVTVNVANASPGTGAAASLFSDEGITSLGTNVAVSDSNGRVVFYVADGKYDLTFTGVGLTTYIRAALEIADITGTTFAADKPIISAIFQIGATDTGLTRLGAASVALGNGTSGDFSGTLKLTILNAVTGIQINGAATSGNVLRGNGTNFVSAQLNYTDLAGTAPSIPGTGQTFNGSTSGSTILKASAVASGTLTLPATTGTLAIGAPQFQKFTANGTFTIPTGVTAVKVIVLGGGGAGGGASTTNSGGGGGAGGAAIKWLSGLTPGSTITVTVGAAGAAGTAGANAGGTGGNSSIASGTQTITTVTANGGVGGAANGASSGGGAGGSCTNGDFNFTGSVGIRGGLQSAAGGGSGAASIFGGGGGEGFGTTGGAATALGAGGGGAGGTVSNLQGGVGGAGLVLFEWVT